MKTSRLMKKAPLNSLLKLTCDLLFKSSLRPYLANAQRVISLEMTALLRERANINQHSFQRGDIIDTPTHNLVPGKY